MKANAYIGGIISPTDRPSDASPRCPHCRYCSLTCAQHAERSTDYAPDVVRDAKRVVAAWEGADSDELDTSVAALQASVQALAGQKRGDGNG